MLWICSWGNSQSWRISGDSFGRPATVETQSRPKIGGEGIAARRRRYGRLVRGACRGGVLRATRRLGEIISFAQAVVDATGDFRGMRTADGAAASPNQPPARFSGALGQRRRRT